MAPRSSLAVGTAFAGLLIALTAAPSLSAQRAPAAGITPSSLAGVGIGATQAQVRKRWGSPQRINRQRLRSGEVEYDYLEASFFGPAGFVVFRGGRAVHVSIAVADSLSTSKGDGAGTTIAAFRHHWPKARKAGPGIYTLPAARAGYVLMFLFQPYDGLQLVDLITPADLSHCVIEHGTC